MGVIGAPLASRREISLPQIAHGPDSQIALRSALD
jgi:hypothetical protein